MFHYYYCRWCCRRYSFVLTMFIFTNFFRVLFSFFSVYFKRCVNLFAITSCVGLCLYITSIYWCKLNLKLKPPHSARFKHHFSIDWCLSYKSMNSKESQQTTPRTKTNFFIMIFFILAFPSHSLWLAIFIDSCKEKRKRERNRQKNRHIFSHICYCFIQSNNNNSNKNSLINADLTSCCSCAQIIFDCVIHLELLVCALCARLFSFLASKNLQFLFYISLSHIFII